MKARYRLFRRGSRYYVEDGDTGRQTSLRTGDKAAAQRIVGAKNEAAAQPAVRLAIAKAYLSTCDPQLITRTWRDLMAIMADRGKPQTRRRRESAFRSAPFGRIVDLKLVETTAEHLRWVMEAGGNSTNLYLRCLHNHGVGLGWLPGPIIPPKLWPRVHEKRKRGITAEEHARILRSEGNQERRLYYQLLWEIGAAQSDAAGLSHENVDRLNGVLSYQRRKTGEWASLRIGSRLAMLLNELPATGALFPTISRSTDSARSAEFCRRCRLAGVTGVSLHSYRYGWAQRARAAGYPMRWAQNALGHNSAAIHQAYARGTIAVCPSLEDYENRAAKNPTIPFPRVEDQPAYEIEERTADRVSEDPARANPRA